MSSEAADFSSVKREFFKYHPNIWDNDFEKTADYPVGEEHNAMKQEIRKMLLSNANEPSEKLKLINIVQRLGIAYHFKTEIEDELTKICNINFEDYHNDLYNVALRFRILRQQGIKVSCDSFEKFKDKDRKFEQSLSEDIEGLLSLYEAAFLGVRGEDILDEAIDFTSKNLKLVLPNLSPYQAEEVARALTRPIRKNLPRLEARHFIRFYEADKSHNKTLAKFAKLDFNMLQVLHQRELKDLLEWWKHWDLMSKLPYARDRIWELQFWVVGVYYEPQYTLARNLLGKMMALFTVIDDTYDNYGKADELESFTRTIQRWDVEGIGALPEYMQTLLQCLFAAMNEIEEFSTRDGKPFATYYVKEFINKLVGSYLTEVKWHDAKYVPTTDEYMEISTVSTCYPMFKTVSFIGMGETVTKETFEWISNYPKSVEASAIVCRLMDDIVDHKFEPENTDHFVCAVECYVKQYKTSEEEATKVLRKNVENAWKDVNEECLRPLPVASDILERVLNFTRVMDVYYKDADGYDHPLLVKDYVDSVLKLPLL